MRRLKRPPRRDRSGLTLGSAALKSGRRTPPLRTRPVSLRFAETGRSALVGSEPVRIGVSGSSWTLDVDERSGKIR